MTKRRSVKDVTIDNNTNKVKKALSSNIFTGEPKYYISITFCLNGDQFMNDPIEWLYTKMGEAFVEELSVGSGTCLMSGDRDFAFSGNKMQMHTILNHFARSEFRISNIYAKIVYENFEGNN